VAVAVDDAVLGKLCAFQKALADATPPESIRWTPRDQMHLTLKFLGNVPAGAVEDLASALKSASQGTGPFRLSAEECGAFPSLRNPRVLWVGLSGETEPLCALQARIETATATWAQKGENRTFHPHLTLGRVRENAMRHARRIGDVVKVTQTPKFGTWEVTEVKLMRSQLSPKGSTHTVLVSVSL